MGNKGLQKNAVYFAKMEPAAGGNNFFWVSSDGGGAVDLLKELNGFTKGTYVFNEDGTVKLRVLEKVYKVELLKKLPSLRTDGRLPGIIEKREVKWMDFDGQEVRGTVRQAVLEIWKDNWKLRDAKGWRGVVFEIVSEQTQVEKKTGFRF